MIICLSKSLWFPIKFSQKKKKSLKWRSRVVWFCTCKIHDVENPRRKIRSFRRVNITCDLLLVR